MEGGWGSCRLAQPPNIPSMSVCPGCVAGVGDPDIADPKWERGPQVRQSGIKKEADSSWGLVDLAEVGWRTVWSVEAQMGRL